MTCNPTIPVQDVAGKTVYMGVFTTFNARSVTFDFSAWVESLGDGTFSVSLLRPGDTTPYAVAGLSINGTLATWTFDATDTALAGYGRAFLSYVTPTAMDMTVDFDVYIAQNSAPSGGTPPDPLETWYQQMLEAAAQAQIAAQNAADSAAAAEGSLDKLPYPDATTRTWWIWDNTVGSYVDSGVKTGGEGGTDNYNDLINQPQINGNTLTGNKNGAALGLVDAVAGKGLSTNDYTDSDKAQLGTNTSAIATNAAQISANQTAISGIKDGASINSFAGVENALSGKQNTLTFDQTPEAGSSNPVTSGGVDTALAGKVNTADYNPDAKTASMTQEVGKDSSGRLWTSPAAQDNAVTVSGTTPVIVAEANTRYICGEVSTLSFTPPASGICNVVFTSGTTATVLTVPSTVRWANDFDPTSLEANTTYEINIMDEIGVAVGVST